MSTLHSKSKIHIHVFDESLRDLQWNTHTSTFWITQFMTFNDVRKTIIECIQSHEDIDVRTGFDHIIECLSSTSRLSIIVDKKADDSDQRKKAESMKVIRCHSKKPTEFGLGYNVYDAIYWAVRKKQVKLSRVCLFFFAVPSNTNYNKLKSNRIPKKHQNLNSSNSSNYNNNNNNKKNININVSNGIPKKHQNLDDSNSSNDNNNNNNNKNSNYSKHGDNNNDNHNDNNNENCNNKSVTSSHKNKENQNKKKDKKKKKKKDKKKKKNKNKKRKRKREEIMIPIHEPLQKKRKIQKQTKTVEDRECIRFLIDTAPTMITNVFHWKYKSKYEVARSMMEEMVHINWAKPECTDNSMMLYTFSEGIKGLLKKPLSAYSRSNAAMIMAAFDSNKSEIINQEYETCKDYKWAISMLAKEIAKQNKSFKLPQNRIILFSDGERGRSCIETKELINTLAMNNIILDIIHITKSRRENKTMQQIATYDGIGTYWNPINKTYADYNAIMKSEIMFNPKLRHSQQNIIELD